MPAATFMRHASDGSSASDEFVGFALENVSGIAKEWNERESYEAVVLAHLKKELGNEFVVGVETTCACTYGLPQSRTRRWLIGQRTDKLTCLGLPGTLPPRLGCPGGSPGMSKLLDCLNPHLPCTPRMSLGQASGETYRHLNGISWSRKSLGKSKRDRSRCAQLIGALMQSGSLATVLTNAPQTHNK